MAANTIARNQAEDVFGDQSEIWLFGYGSLIFKAGFPYDEKRPARICGWERRFWQGSHDHRGTEQAPGRVATLIPVTGGLCAGIAYRISPEQLGHLDYREKNGYLRHALDLEFDDRSRHPGLVYVATEKNDAWMGPASEREIAHHIAHAEGPSGRNDDYVVRLAAALRAMAAEDVHVFEVERHLRTIRGKGAAE